MDNQAFAHNENSASPAVHSANIRRQLGELIDHLVADVSRVSDPKFRALLEVSAEVLRGVRTAYLHYDDARMKNLNPAE
ncbi:MAG TPA: hypothetical protein VG734_06845 [Lacunisphaera sp.]|nr:hypothetical protein [Lacunisphaera sp.]